MSQNEESFINTNEEEDSNWVEARNILVEQLIHTNRSLIDIDYIQTFSEGDDIV